MADDITEFVRRESRVDRDREVMKPEFSFLITRPDVNVCGLIAFVGIKESPIRTPAENGWHVSRCDTRVYTSSDWHAPNQKAMTRP